MSQLLHAFYGDDFTGSTDVLEQLAMGGIRTALFFSTPTSDDLESIPGLQAVGVAGDSRSQSPEWMSAYLPQVFSALFRTGAPLLQYKVCSTFDSSPTRGNIGRALEIGLDVSRCRYVPIVIGAPHLRRYVMDGKLFASDADGLVQRIDRHPMSFHPATPMREARLARHLAEQTTVQIGEISHAADIRHLATMVDRAVNEGNRGLLFDAIDAQDLEQCGDVIWRHAERQSLFAVGSSGLTAALISAWQQRRMVRAADPVTHQGAKGRGPLLVVSGSCSVVTARQVEWSLANGFVGVKIDPENLLSTSKRGYEPLIDALSRMLSDGHDVVAYTALGPPSTPAYGDELGRKLGTMLKRVLLRTPLRRLLVCGGDTSSQSIRQLGLRALTWKAKLQPGVPLCQASAKGHLHGLEIALKGGQMGSEDFFSVVRDAPG